VTAALDVARTLALATGEPLAGSLGALTVEDRRA
jgi:hypothetical protein